MFFGFEQLAAEPNMRKSAQPVGAIGINALHHFYRNAVLINEFFIRSHGAQVYDQYALVVEAARHKRGIFVAARMNADAEKFYPYIVLRGSKQWSKKQYQRQQAANPFILFPAASHLVHSFLFLISKTGN